MAFSVRFRVILGRSVVGVLHSGVFVRELSVIVRRMLI